MPNSAPPPDCSGCGLRDACLAAGLDRPELAALGTMLCAGPELAAGEYLFWGGDQARGIFAVHSGCVKTFTTDADGNERVRGFHLAGDLIGLDALWSGTHVASAQALSPTSFCLLPASRIERANAELAGLRRRLLGMISRDLAAALSRSGDYTAEQRLAAFLLDVVARRRQGQANSRCEVMLPMGRRDIANYLRLATETVSRVLTRFRQRGLIEVDGQWVRLVEPEMLASLAAELCGADSAARLAA